MANDGAMLRFRTPLLQRGLSLFGAAILSLLTCFFAGLAVVGLLSTDRSMTWLLCLMGSAGTAVMAALAVYVVRDLRGKLGLHVELDGSAVQLHLPATRSLTRRVPGVHVTLPLDTIGAIETRYEAYRSLGMVTLLRAYVLVQKNQERLFLFEDRASATGMQTASAEAMAQAITERARAGWRDIGMVACKGGFLCVWGARAAEWTAPPVSRGEAEALWRRAAITGRLALAGASLAARSGPFAIYQRSSPGYPAGIYPGGKRQEIESRS